MQLAVLLCGFFPLAAQERIDTLRVSGDFTTHVVFSTDVIYANLSNSQYVRGQIIEQSKNIVALIAKEPFEGAISLSALESNGRMRTFVVVYDSRPSTLIYYPSGKIGEAADSPADRKSGEGLFRKLDAPLPQQVLASGRALYHIYSQVNDIEVSCTNILTYSDITYLVFSLTNRSGVSYECNNANFVVESKRKARKHVSYENQLIPRSRYGALSSAPGETSSMVYTMDKLSLTSAQVLRVYFYEDGGQRELVLTLHDKDINKAKNSL